MTKGIRIDEKNEIEGVNHLKAMYMFNTHLMKNDEIHINTNTMLIGTNGAGKSTTMKLLTFFYTANERLLEIEKDRSVCKFDTFFPTTTSFIVYEYEKKDHTVLLVLRRKEKVGKSGGLEAEKEFEFCFYGMEKSSYDNVKQFFVGKKPIDIWNGLDEAALFSIKVSKRDYLSVLYGQNKKDNSSLFSFSHVENYKTYAKLLYSAFTNTSLDSNSVKSIIIDYALTKSGRSPQIGLGTLSDSIMKFKRSYHTVEMWEQGVGSIDQLRVFVREIEMLSLKRVKLLGEIRTELNIFARREGVLAAEIGEKEEALEKYEKDAYPEIRAKAEDIIKKHEKMVWEAQKEIEGIEKRNRDYKDNRELQEAIKIQAHIEAYKNELRKNKELISVMESKYKSKQEAHREILSKLEAHCKTQTQEAINIAGDKKAVLHNNKISNSEKLEKERKLAAEQFSVAKYDEAYQVVQPKLNSLKVQFEKESMAIFDTQQYYEQKERGYLKKDEEIERKVKELTSSDDLINEKKEEYDEQLSKKKISIKSEAQEKIDKINEQLEAIELSESSKDTLLSQISSLRLDMRKYTGILSQKALQSTDFIINTEGRDGKPTDFVVNAEGGDGEPSIVLDFLINQDSELIASGESLYEIKKRLGKERDEIKSEVRRAIGELEKEQQSYTGVYRKKREAIKIEKEECLRKRASLRDLLLELQEVRDRKKKIWEEEKEKSIEEISQQIAERVKEVKEIEENKKRDKEALADRIKEIDAQVLNIEMPIREIEDELKIEKSKLGAQLEKDKEEEERRYSREIGIAVKWELKIEEVQEFYDEVYVHYTSKTSSLNSLMEDQKKIVSEQNEVKRKAARKLDELREEMRRLKNENKILQKGKTEFENIILQNKELVADVDAEEESLIAEDRDVLISEDRIAELSRSMQSVPPNLELNEKGLHGLISGTWSNFILANDLIIFAPDNLTRAKQIIETDRTDKIGLHKELVYSEIKMLSNRISDEYISLNDAFKAVESAIRRINSDLEDIGMAKLIKSIRLDVEKKENNIFDAMKKVSNYWREHEDTMERNLFSDVSKTGADVVKIRDDFFGLLDGFVKQLGEGRTELNISSLFVLKSKISEKGNEGLWAEGVIGRGSDGTKVLIKAGITAALFSMALGGSKERHAPLLLMDEIGRLHDNNVQEIIGYINSKDCLFLSVQPNKGMAKYFGRTYYFRVISHTQTRIIDYTRRMVPLQFKEVL